MSDAPAETSVETMTFEEAMAALEEVVRKLDDGDVPLERSIALYERGAKLKVHCDAKLREAEEKVAKLTLDADGAPKGTGPLDP